MSTVYTNVDCLTKSKKTELEVIIAKNKPDVIAVTEIYPKHSNLINSKEFYNFQGYDAFLSDLSSGRGVVIYVKDELSAVGINIEEQYKESLWCELKLKGNDQLVVGCVYRSPNSPRADIGNLIKTLNQVVMKGFSHVLIMGDFNLKEI